MDLCFSLREAKNINAINASTFFCNQFCCHVFMLNYIETRCIKDDAYSIRYAILKIHNPPYDVYEKYVRAPCAISIVVARSSANREQNFANLKKNEGQVRSKNPSLWRKAKRWLRVHTKGQLCRRTCGGPLPTSGPTLSFAFCPRYSTDGTTL